MPIIERYMSLKRQETVLLSEFDAMNQNTPLPFDDYNKIFGIFSALLALLCDTEDPVLIRLYSATLDDYGAELAALDEVMAEVAKKTQETRVKSTYSARAQSICRTLGSTSRVLTSSVVEIAHMKNEIKMLLQQM